MGKEEEWMTELKEKISVKLKELEVDIDEELPDYIAVLVQNNKKEDEICTDLDVFLNDHSADFSKWLTETVNDLRAKGEEKKDDEKILSAVVVRSGRRRRSEGSRSSTMLLKRAINDSATSERQPRNETRRRDRSRERERSRERLRDREHRDRERERDGPRRQDRKRESVEEDLRGNGKRARATDRLGVRRDGEEAQTTSRLSNRLGKKSDVTDRLTLHDDDNDVDLDDDDDKNKSSEKAPLEKQKSDVRSRLGVRQDSLVPVFVDNIGAATSNNNTQPPPGVVACNKFPNCPFISTCKFWHPVIICKFQNRCTNPKCNYTHVQKPPASYKAAPKKKKFCKFGANCAKIGRCPFVHPKPKNSTTTTTTIPCKFGAGCTRKDTCKFSHAHISERKFAADTAEPLKKAEENATESAANNTATAQPDETTATE
eukprot:m.340451 g.340451  ORF g.340451 m.340451 type:complete len:430 (+) comp19316_c0_seq1:155-1444(+)